MNKSLATIRRWVPLIGGGALLAYTAVFLFRRARGHEDLGERPRDEGRDEGNDKGDKAFRGKWSLPEGARLARPGVEDLVDEAAVESFPASDPPGFTPTRVG
jgi:hypothetical protein